MYSKPTSFWHAGLAQRCTGLGAGSLVHLVQFDGDAPLPLQIQGIQELGLQYQHTGSEQQPSMRKEIEVCAGIMQL